MSIPPPAYNTPGQNVPAPTRYDPIAPPSYHNQSVIPPPPPKRAINRMRAENELTKRVAREAEEKVRMIEATEIAPENSGPTTMESVTASAGALASSVASMFQPSTEPHELWSFTNALFFIILFILVIWITVYGMSALVNIQHIKDDWANQRCSPLIMPFASFFGANTSDNFEFCMGKIFTTHSQGYMGSVSGMFSGFTGLLQNIFDSIGSLRNTIASLGGGINVIFQEFTERISSFFFQLRMSAVRIKMLMGRLYATLFSVMYMGMSGITGMTSFTNTFLFSFLDTFCFPGNTEVMVEEKGQTRRVPIKDVKIGDVLVPGHTRVTATFQFHSRGQAMVQLGPVLVSTNHYIHLIQSYFKVQQQFLMLDNQLIYHLYFDFLYLLLFHQLLKLMFQNIPK